MKKVIVIGGGASGMLAAVLLGRAGCRVELFEKNEKLGKKLYITGKGRCNLTNACDTQELFGYIVRNPKFMFSSIYGFNNADTISFFEGMGLKTKVERGGRVFPVSDHSSDVIKVLASELEKNHVTCHLNREVERIITENGSFRAVRLNNGNIYEGDYCLIATGGCSYPSTGSTGDGYRFARDMGHSVTELYPSLTGIHTKEHFVRELEGLSLKNVQLTVNRDGKMVFSELGELLFTHNGISGPLVLKVSSLFTEDISKQKNIEMSIDLKPGLTKEQLDERLLRDFAENKNKQFKNSLDNLLPRKLIAVIIEHSCIEREKQVNSISREERRKLVSLLKALKLNAASCGSFNEAVITRGGVSIKEINPATMESKLVHGVYFTGEVLDVDAMTGGFNLQIAWSTAYAAADNIIREQI